MDRQILFRGKRADKFKPGEWICGYYVPCCFGTFPCLPAIVPEPDGKWEPLEVDPSTVGQYTGLTDKNGKKIFEGDIIEFVAYGVDYKGVASFKDGNFFVNCKRVDPFLDNVVFKYRATVIGNIHDGKDGAKQKEAAHD